MPFRLRIYSAAVHGPAAPTAHPKKLRLYGARVVAGSTPKKLRIYGARVVKDSTPKKLRLYGARVVSTSQPARPVQRKVGGAPVTINVFRKVSGSQVQIT